ncbi:zinc finger SWIM domain-containing protein 7 isoform X2 [Dendrobates tinctorius]|uniref:zinc finger SWIM domain-containing protein 7 isoform X2 n=1 Tax=Dendrobates tinctorius TaxID=92724 RepID=UPI003CC9ABBB
MVPGGLSPSVALEISYRKARLQRPSYSASCDVPVNSCSVDMDFTLPSAAEELLQEIKRLYQETSQISDEHLLGLKFIFGPTALYALDLVDQRSVTHVTSPSGRSTFQVTGSSGKMYTCYKASHYCSCPAFSFSVLRRQDSLMGNCISHQVFRRWENTGGGNTFTVIGLPCVE